MPLLAFSRWFLPFVRVFLPEFSSLACRFPEKSGAETPEYQYRRLAPEGGSPALGARKLPDKFSLRQRSFREVATGVPRGVVGPRFFRVLLANIEIGGTMDFTELQPAILIKRYKRFLADVRFPDGREVTVHCPNTGAMTGCAEVGMPVWLSHHADPKRKLAWTWELVDTGAGLACIHSALANKVVGEAIGKGVLDALPMDGELKREVPFGEGSRADFSLTSGSLSIMIEVKAVTFVTARGLGVFPDTPSQRALKHVHALVDVVRSGGRAALVYCALHSAIGRIAPAASVDPIYADAVRDAVAQGLEVYGLGVDINPQRLEPSGQVPVSFWEDAPDP